MLTLANLANELVCSMKAQLSETNDGDLSQHIINSVCDALNVSYTDLISAEKTTDLVEARFIIMHILVRQQKLTTTKAGRLLNRDHSTVLYGIGKYKTYLDTNDKQFLDKIDKAMEGIAI